MKVNGMGSVDRSVKNAEIMGKKIGTAAVPAVPKGSMESINFLGGPVRVASDRYEYEKALCVQVNHLKQRQVILSDNVIVL